MDPQSGRSYYELKRTVPVYYLYADGEENAGGLDLDALAEDIDPTCTVSAGGICNTTSMAARRGYSKKTLVNSIMPLVRPHRIGGVLITNVASLDYATNLYVEEMAARQRQNGLRRAHGTHVGGGQAVGSASAVTTTAPIPRR